MNTNFSVIIEGVEVKATFKKSAVKNPDYDGDLSIEVSNGNTFDLNEEIQATEKKLSETHIVSFGTTPNQFTIGYVKASECAELFEKVCSEFEYCYYSL